MRLRILVGIAAAIAAVPHTAGADPTSGVDANLYRPALDATGVYTLEGGSVMPKGTVSVTTSAGYSQTPLNVPVPGIGGDEANDSVLKYAIGLHLGVGFAFSDRWSIGIDAGLYRTDPDQGYGERGRYRDSGPDASTGLQSLRPVSNIDPAGGFLDDGLAGPLDTRIGIKYRLTSGKKLRASLLGIVSLPFGDDEMFLGDSNLVYEPKLAVDYLLNASGSSKFVFNLGARFRERNVVEAYDSTMSGADPSSAQVVLDIGSELVAGAGVNFELLDRFSVSAEGTVLVPLPPSLSYGTCRLANGDICHTNRMTYFAGGDKGDLAAFALSGLNYRVTAETTLNLMAGVGLAGARKEAFRVMTGITWTPSSEGSRAVGKNDADGDGIPDNVDICPNEPEDKDNYKDEDGCPDLDNDGDGIIDAKDKCPDDPEDKDDFQDEDGCPEPDNDKDSVPDVTDQCPNEPEDKDGFQDDDGCPDEDNDGDGFADKKDKCPNRPETVNGYRDNDGCPDVKPGGIRLAVDRIDLRGGVIKFTTRRGVRLTRTARTLLDQVAEMIKGKNRLNKRLNIRVSDYVALSYKGRVKWRLRRARAADKRLAQRRASVIVTYLVRKGVPRRLVRGLGIGSIAPIKQPGWSQINSRVEFIRITQGGGGRP